ncbi:CRISPR-associated protein Csx18 [Synechococcus sp. CS-1328]|uniref:CRISPR-associated protein Csx18 n=1 Tax=Synechococcus sp. CS-1328 TaxID=2847976 RepID=UPI00223AD79C|nr:CRISPR-associated protein Csx18 [Synechococcus sp. CS-1328]MCT0224002.1 hypothetical protein [Synechococcus sp. CS-1328]
MTRPSLLVHAVVAGVNGLISLTLLLIAPLGLATVITLTLLLTLSTFLGGLSGEGVLRWLQHSRQRPWRVVRPAPRGDRQLSGSREP